MDTAHERLIEEFASGGQQEERSAFDSALAVGAFVGAD